MSQDMQVSSSYYKCTGDSISPEIYEKEYYIAPETTHFDRGTLWLRPSSRQIPVLHFNLRDRCDILTCSALYYPLIAPLLDATRAAPSSTLTNQ
jgi:hypothetical protein